MPVYEGDAARFLTEIVRARIALLDKIDQGAYDAAAADGDELARSIADYLHEQGPESGWVLPHRAQWLALIGDLLFLAVASGRLQDLPEGIDLVRAELASVLDNLQHGAYIAGVVCDHGQPSMDGECLKKPPCPAP